MMDLPPGVELVDEIATRMAITDESGIRPQRPREGTGCTCDR